MAKHSLLPQEQILTCSDWFSNCPRVPETQTPDICVGGTPSTDPLSGGGGQFFPGLPLVVCREAKPPGPVVDLHVSSYPNNAVIHSVLLLSCIVASVYKRSSPINRTFSERRVFYWTQSFIPSGLLTATTPI